jgi:hypothetical protein
MYTDIDTKIIQVCVLKIDNQFFDTSDPNAEYMLCDSTNLLETGAWSLGFYPLAAMRPESIPAAISVIYMSLYHRRD